MSLSFGSFELLPLNMKLSAPLVTKREKRFRLKPPSKLPPAIPRSCDPRRNCSRNHSPVVCGLKDGGGAGEGPDGSTTDSTVFDARGVGVSSAGISFSEEDRLEDEDAFSSEN